MVGLDPEGKGHPWSPRWIPFSFFCFHVAVASNALEYVNNDIGNERGLVGSISPDT